MKQSCLKASFSPLYLNHYIADDAKLEVESH